MSILTGPTGIFGDWKDGPKREHDDKPGRKDDGHDWKSKGDKDDDGKDGGKHGRKDDDHDWKSKDDKHDGKDGGKHGRKDDDHDWKSKDDKHDDKDGGKHGRKDDDHDWKSKDDKHDGKDGDKHARKDDDKHDGRGKDDCDNGNDNGNHQDDCEPVCCEPEPDCDVHAALVGMSDVGSVVDFAIDSLSPGQGMDMGQFDMGGAPDSLGA